MVGLFFVDNNGEDWIEDMKKTKIVGLYFTSGGTKDLKTRRKHFLFSENNSKSADSFPYLPKL